MSKEFVVLSVNPGFDRWLLVHSQSPFKTVVRADSVIKCVSGKGINIARVFNSLGFKGYICPNLVGGRIGDLISSDCEEEGLHTVPYRVRDESRINFSIIRTFERSIQTYNEPGPLLEEGEVFGFIDLVKGLLLTKKDLSLVISGSMATGFSTEHLSSLVRWACQNDVEVCVDIGGEWLKRIIENSLAVLKINREEFLHAFDIDIVDNKAVMAFKERHRIRFLIITDGKNGSYAWDEHGSRYHVHVRDIPNSVGFTVACGDSFFAGYLVEMAQGKVLEECLITANACGIANTLHYGPAVFSKEDVELCKSAVDIEYA